MARRTDSLELTFKDHRDHDNSVIVDAIPDECPVCERGIDARFLGAYGKHDLRRGHFIQSIHQCPREECQAVFIAYYTSGSWYGSGRGNDHVFLHKTFVRSYVEDEIFDEEIEKLSPKFVQIFTQASIAENTGLKDICGMGYRKALEFLIKDYLILLKPKEKTAIETHSLGWLIANKIENERIKQTAGLAKEAGNDETHYIRKIEQLTVEDLKKLIRLTTHWIVDELLTKEYAEMYEQLMSEKGRSTS